MAEEAISPEAVLAELVKLLAQIVGDEMLIEVEVGPATRFNEDLALESIEFVALAEKLQQRYGGRVDFTAFVAEMDIDQIMAMTVGQLVDHISSCLAPVQPGAVT